MTSFTMPFPIALRSAWKFTRRGAYKSKEYEAFLNESFFALRSQKVFLTDQAYKVEIYLHSDAWLTKKGKISRTAGDVDNRLKCLLDAIVKYCKSQNQLFDDCFITELRVFKKQDLIQKKAVLRFEPITFI
jgi:Holliday junction resolvase RusA-like endonuclease